MLFTSQGRSALGKTVPSALCSDRGRTLRAVSKTSGTVFPNTDRPWLVKNVYIFIDRFHAKGDGTQWKQVRRKWRAYVDKIRRI